jgi:hypothetical protein
MEVALSIVLKSIVEILMAYSFDKCEYFHGYDASE